MISGSTPWHRILAWRDRHRHAAWIDLPLRTYAGWSRDGVPRLAAAISYYTVFSLAPLLVIVLGTLGLTIDPGLIEHHLLHQIGGLIGDDAARAIGDLLRHARTPATGVLSTVISLLVLLLGAVGVFIELKGSLNLIWGVRIRPGVGLLQMATRYLAPLGMVLGIGFLLLVSLLFSAVLAAIGSWLGRGGILLPWLLDQSIGWALISGLFALIYLVLPDVEVPRWDAIVAAMIAGFLFEVGRWAIGQYLGRTTLASSYGAAGSFAVVLVWIYYSAQILLLGVEICRARAERGGRSARPSALAESICAMPSGSGR